MDGVFSFRSSIRVLSILWNGYFRIDGVKSVFFGGDFITVTKYDDEGVEWKVIDRMCLHVLWVLIAPGAGDEARDFRHCDGLLQLWATRRP